MTNRVKKECLIIRFLDIEGAKGTSFSFMNSIPCMDIYVKSVESGINALNISILFEKINEINSASYAIVRKRLSSSEYPGRISVLIKLPSMRLNSPWALKFMLKMSTNGVTYLVVFV